jgi:L-asparaginase
MYWLHLLVDCTVPVCGNAAHRPHGQVSGNGAKNLIGSVDYIVSGVGADETGRNRAGMVLIQQQQIFAAPTRR